MNEPRDVEAELIRRSTYQMEAIARLRIELDAARESNKMLISALLAKEGENFDKATAEIGRLRARVAELELPLKKWAADGCNAWEVIDEPRALLRSSSSNGEKK